MMFLGLQAIVWSDDVPQPEDVCDDDDVDPSILAGVEDVNILHDSTRQLRTVTTTEQFTFENQDGSAQGTKPVEATVASTQKEINSKADPVAATATSAQKEANGKTDPNVQEDRVLSDGTRVLVTYSNGTRYTATIEKEEKISIWDTYYTVKFDDGHKDDIVTSGMVKVLKEKPKVHSDRNISAKQDKKQKQVKQPKAIEPDSQDRVLSAGTRVLITYNPEKQFKATILQKDPTSSWGYWIVKFDDDDRRDDSVSSERMEVLVEEPKGSDSDRGLSFVDDGLEKLGKKIDDGLEKLGKKIDDGLKELWNHLGMQKIPFEAHDKKNPWGVAVNGVSGDHFDTLPWVITNVEPEKQFAKNNVQPGWSVHSVEMNDQKYIIANGNQNAQEAAQQALVDGEACSIIFNTEIKVDALAREYINQNANPNLEDFLKSQTQIQMQMQIQKQQVAQHVLAKRMVKCSNTKDQTVETLKDTFKKMKDLAKIYFKNNLIKLEEDLQKQEKECLIQYTQQKKNQKNECVKLLKELKVMVSSEDKFDSWYRNVQAAHGEQKTSQFCTEKGMQEFFADLQNQQPGWLHSVWFTDAGIDRLKTIDKSKKIDIVFTVCEQDGAPMYFNTGKSKATADSELNKLCAKCCGSAVSPTFKTNELVPFPLAECKINQNYCTLKEAVKTWN